MTLPNIEQNATVFNARFKKHEFEYISLNKRQIGYFFYLPFRDGEVTTREFLNYLIGEAINYAIPYANREQIQKDITPSNWSFVASIRQDVKSMFSHTKSSGDFGELIIYLILRDFFNAPQIVNKLSLKTAGNMPYHGADGIHMQFENDNLLLYFAESKLKDVHTTTAQIKEAISSAKELLNNTQVPNQVIGKREFEINLVKKHFTLPNITSEQKRELLSYLNPLKPNSNNIKYVSTCLIGFDFKFYKEIQSASNVEELFKNKYKEVINKSIKTIETELKDNQMQGKNLNFVILPFESIVDFRKQFLELL